jgi:hypothetical protein
MKAPHPKPIFALCRSYLSISAELPKTAPSLTTVTYPLKTGGLLLSSAMAVPGSFCLRRSSSNFHKCPRPPALSCSPHYIPDHSPSPSLLSQRTPRCSVPCADLIAVQHLFHVSSRHPFLVASRYLFPRRPILFLPPRSSSPTTSLSSATTYPSPFEQHSSLWAT